MKGYEKCTACVLDNEQVGREQDIFEQQPQVERWKGMRSAQQVIDSVIDSEQTGREHEIFEQHQQLSSWKLWVCKEEQKLCCISIS